MRIRTPRESAPSLETFVTFVTLLHVLFCAARISDRASTVPRLVQQLNFGVEFSHAHLSSGAALTHSASANGATVFSLDLAVADAIVLR